MTPCPPNDKWQAYADSRLGADEDGSFTAHVQDCPECEASLKALVAAPACGREKIRAKPALPPELVKGLCKLWDRTLEPEDLTSPGWWPKLDGYEILSVLGRGGMGVVYRAIEVDLGREVAVKMIAAGAGCSPSDIQRLLNEARTAAQLKHQHIVPVYSVSQHREQPCCVMEFLPAGSLAQRLNDLVNEPRETARLVAAVARAVTHAHAQGVFHRDVKTTNILLRACDSSNTENYSSAAGTSALLPRLRDLDACLSDFGLAKQTRDDAGLTHTGAMVGTPGYMAPEQIRSQQATAAGDIFGLGAVLYECLTGQAPFRGATPFDALLLTLHQEPQRPRALNSRLHRDLETICLRCLEKEPQRRYASAAALAEDLELWLRGEPVRARPIGPLGRTWRRCRRYPLIAGLSLVLVLVAVAGISGIVYHWRAAEAARGEAETSNGDAEQLIGELIQNHAIAPLDALHMDFYRREPSIQALLKAESHCWRLWQKNPGDVSRRISLTNVLGALGTLYSARAEIAEAKRRFQQARDLWEPIVRERPANPEYRDWLATVLVWQARIETSQEHLMRSVQSIQEAHLLWQDLIEEQPENLAFLEKLGDCLQTMYSIIKTKRWRTSVKPLLEESHALLTRRLQQEPANRVIRKRLAQTCLLLNALRSQESAPQEAEAYLRQAYDHYKKLAESPGIDLQVRLSLGTCCYRLMGRQAQDPYYLEAVALFEETRKYLESQADQDPQQGWLQDAILRNGCSLALCHWKAGRSADAEKTYRNQVAALAAQARENPNAPLLTCQLLGTFSYLASALWELKLPAPALAIARDATVVAFAIGVPARDLGTRERHGWQLLSLAATLSHLEDPEEALRLAERARHISEDLCRELPLQPNFVSLLSGAWQRIGKARWALHQPDLALAAFREAASVQHRTFEAAPSAEARARLSNCYDRLYYWNTLRHTWSEAAAALLDREKLWLDNAEELMEVARDFQGLAEKMTEPRQQLSSAQERERQHYLAESARLSRAADALHDK